LARFSSPNVVKLLDFKVVTNYKARCPKMKRKEKSFVDHRFSQRSIQLLCYT